MATTTKGQTRVARPMAALLLLLVGLYTYVLARGLEPRLGLDLRGGTSVILVPDQNRPAPSQESLNKAVDIIRQRVDGTGVAEAEVVTEGGTIRVALPDVGREDALALVGTTAELTFRHVQQATAPGPATPATPAPNTSVTPSPAGSPRPGATVQPSPSATTNRRPVSGALLAQQPSPSPSRSPSPSAPAGPAPTGNPTAVPSPVPGGQLSEAEIQKLFQETDCTDEAQRNVGRRFSAEAPLIVSCNRDGTVKYLLGAAEMMGTDVRDALATVDAGGTVSTGQWIVQLNFTKDGTRKFADITRKYTGQQVAIVLDGVVQSDPQIEEPITGGTAQITGTFTSKEARDLSNVLKYGALPVVFNQSEGQTQTISPTLGEESLRGGLIAGILGLALVIIYSILYYRGLGLVTVMGLTLFAALNFAMVVVLGQAIGFTLSLAGIAGLIVSVGITADSYVVFYERLKDEAREGKSLRQSVDRGFQRAIRTILAADFVSFLAAATLYVLSIGGVRGFAFTLGLSTIIDVVIAFLFTRPMVTLLARTKLFTEGRFVGIRAAVSAPTVKGA